MKYCCVKQCDITDCVLGFTAKGVKGNQEAFFSEFPLLAIAHVIVDGNLMHYVVIHKISKKEE